MSKLPPIYCITLKKTPDREKETWEHFEQIGLNVIPWYGIHGKSFGVKSTINHNKNGWTISEGHTGLVLAHYMLWQHLLYMDEKEVIILEDDAVLTKDFKSRFFDAKEKLPRNWHCLFLGWLDKHAPNRNMKVIERPVFKCTGDPVFGTHCMYLNREGIKTLWETNARCQNHIDTQIYQRTCQPPKVNFNYYVCYPSLVRQRSMEGKWKSITGGNKQKKK